MTKKGNRDDHLIYFILSFSISRGLSERCSRKEIGDVHSPPWTYCTVQRCTVLYCTVVHPATFILRLGLTVLYCTVLYLDATISGSERTEGF